jgi:hypothetical protein
MIRDRKGLERMAGGAYGVPEAEYRRLIWLNQPRPRASGRSPTRNQLLRLSKPFGESRHPMTRCGSIAVASATNSLPISEAASVGGLMS